jgi:hypothetical protein
MSSDVLIQPRADALESLLQYSLHDGKPSPNGTKPASALAMVFCFDFMNQDVPRPAIFKFFVRIPKIRRFSRYRTM